MPLWSRIGVFLVVAAGLRVGYLLTRYVFGSANVQRFHVESAVFLFAVIGLGLRMSCRSERVEVRPTVQPNPLVTLPVFGAIAFVVYWPALFVGFLSDDFLLIHRASNWQLGALTLELFRPLPLAVWALVLQLGGGATIIHALNIALHGTNAWLTAQLASGWIRNSWMAVGAGLLMLTMPLAPEAVVWSAGVFDVMATTLVLATVLVARRYATTFSYGTRVLFFALAILALLAKETAAVLPLLVFIDAWIRKAYPRKLIRDAGALLLMFGAVGALRLAVGFGATAPPISVRSVRHLLFRSFGGLAFPWHEDVFRALPILLLVHALLLLVIISMFFLRASNPKLTRVAIGCVAWILIGVLPVFHVFFISNDLQSARYAYLSAVAWCGLLAVVMTDISSITSWSRPLVQALLILTVAISAIGVRLHLRPWLQAAVLRDAVEQQAVQSRDIQHCRRVTLGNLPDSVRGAYVFRVGAAEDFERVLQSEVRIAVESGSCSFRWDEHRMTFIAIPFSALLFSFRRH